MVKRDHEYLYILLDAVKDSERTQKNKLQQLPSSQRGQTGA